MNIQQPTMPFEMQEALQELKEEVLRDSWNLTQDDHLAIVMKVDELKQFIDSRYAKSECLT